MHPYAMAQIAVADGCAGPAHDCRRV